MRTIEECKAEVFRRSEERIKTRRKNIKIFTSAASCLCLAAVIGIGIWQVKTPDDTPVYSGDGQVDYNGYNAPDGENEGLEGSPEGDMPTGSTGDVIGMIVYNGRTFWQEDEYLQENTTDEELGLSENLGNMRNFEGTYKDIKGVEGEVYTVKDKPHILCVKLNNGAYIILEEVER